MSGPRHYCGVVGITAGRNVVAGLQKALMIIQHRGQDSAGISVFDGNSISTVKDAGLVQTALPKERIENLNGNVGIGHVRYATTGGKGSMNAQPMIMTTAFGMIALAHNGDLTNYEKLKTAYMAKGAAFQTDSDTELIINLISRRMGQDQDPVKAIKAVMSEIEGAYALSLMINGRLFGIRDPLGIRPLCIGKLDDGYMICSESSAVYALGGELVRDVAPGEIVELTKDIVKSYAPNSRIPYAHCYFEWVYFARPDSVIDGREVYEVRKNVGRVLAREHPADVDLVMPIPDSGRAHAIGFAIESGLPYEEGFMKNRFAERTFILPDQAAREKAVSSKMIPIKSTVNGKRILIIDDSIVRGTTLKRLVTMLRDAGATEVHVRIGSPPIIAPCFYGIDMKNREQFIANKHTVDEIREIIGADSLGYISIEGLVEAIGKPVSDLCLACVNGKYPTKIEGEEHRYQTKLTDIL
ncbi:amidophosphoribosyltransferase PurF [methanogenic archaeon ISO4-H5]|nr:amidophosphoribosyltransferase PurF [methanogenic archaeon ISO4-H5]